MVTMIIWCLGLAWFLCRLFAFIDSKQWKICLFLKNDSVCYLIFMILTACHYFLPCLFLIGAPCPYEWKYTSPKSKSITKIVKNTFLALSFLEFWVLSFRNYDLKPTILRLICCEYFNVNVNRD